MSATEAAGADLRARTVRLAPGGPAAGRPARDRAAVRWAAQDRAARDQAAQDRAAAGQGPARARVPAAAAGQAAPLRLTRRGRLVLAAAALVTALVLVLLLAPGVAGGVSGHPPARAAYQHMKQIVVRAGQSLWSIAAAAEPSADPRIVVQQIIEANALGGTSIRAGQLLWVPRS
jgi:LysM domain